MPNSIEEAIYGPFGQSTPRTFDQMRRDAFAKQALEASYAPSFAAIEAEEQRRGDPMARGIEAAVNKLKYERLQPAGSQSSIAASFGGNGPLAGMEVGSDAVGARYQGGPTIEDAIRQQEQERLAHIRSSASADDQVNAQNSAMRGQIVQELTELEMGLSRLVREGKLDPSVAAGRLKEAQNRARSRVEMLKTGFPPRDPFGTDDPTFEAPGPTPTPRPSPRY